MSGPVPVTLETERLFVRPLAAGDLPAIHDILDVALGEGGSLAERARWLEWTTLGYRQFARLHQPPYGERAIALKRDGALVGACGYVPCLDCFAQVPGLAPAGSGRRGLTSSEFGLYYAIAPAHRRAGYATEAAQALLDYAFRELRLARVVATTTYDNAASIGVMRSLGMRIERNPYPEPPWLQIVGVAENNL